MLKLELFTKSDFPTLINWIDTKELLYQFAGPQFKFPLSVNQLEDYINIPSKVIMKMVDTTFNEMIGHCEFNYHNSELPRLSRILIDPSKTGQGLGKKLIELMIEEMVKQKNPDKIDLCVFSWNKVAIRCYQKVGFQVKPENTTIFENDTIRWERLNMVLELTN